jgi:hypothetical protein
MLKIKKGLMVNEYAGAAAVNWIVLIEVELEMATDVRVLVSNVAVLSGTSGFEVQFVPRVHSAFVTPVQVPSVACAAPWLSVASAPSQTPPSNAARLKAERAAAGTIRIALLRIAAPGAAARVACGRHRYERILQPLRAAPAAHPNHRARVPRERIVAPRPTLRAELVTINSRSSVSARIAAACGFPATRLHDAR